MTKRMLINATQKEENRVAIVSGKTLFDLDIERTGRIQKKASIYKGRVTRVEPSLEAAFVDYGAERHGFLPIKEVAREYYGPNYEGGRPHIRDALKPGQEILVQIDKEERGNKGAALTTFVGLAGCYLVLMPNNPRAGGISRRIDGEEREEIKNALNQLNVPKGMGLIVRTAGVGRDIEELKWDLDVLLNQWDAIQQVSNSREAPLLIHRESDVIIRAIRDYLRPEISEILVDTPDAYQHALHHVQIIRPDYANRLKEYNDPIPLFNRFQIESQIESAFKREIQLENGASIVIDHTEALIAIDINSARATEGSDIEETAFQTNMAAAKEIARQLRLRDIGGLIVIDFIDMSSPKHQRLVENHLREELSADRARIQLGKISRFGLMEMSRQRLRPSLGDFSHITCPRCEGQGSVRTIQSLALSIMRIVEDEAMKENTAKVIVQAPVDLATFLVNEKRTTLSILENRHNMKIVLVPNPHMVTPQYEVSRVRQEEDAQAQGHASYTYMVAPQAETDEKLLAAKAEVVVEPAIKQYNASKPAPVMRESGFIQRLWKAVFGQTETQESEQPKPHRRDAHRPKHHRDNRRSDRSGQRRGGQRRQHSDNRGHRHEGGQHRDAHEGNRRDAHEGLRRDAHEGNRRDAHEGNRRDAHEGHRREHHDDNRREQHEGNRREHHEGNRRDGHEGGGRRGDQEGRGRRGGQQRRRQNPRHRHGQGGGESHHQSSRGDHQKSDTALMEQTVLQTSSFESQTTPPVESNQAEKQYGFNTEKEVSFSPVQDVPEKTVIEKPQSVKAPQPQPAPAEKPAPVQDEKAIEAARRAQNATSFSAFSEAQRASSVVTMTESPTPAAPRSEPMKQVITNKDKAKEYKQSDTGDLRITSTNRASSENRDNKAQVEESESSDK